MNVDPDDGADVTSDVGSFHEERLVLPANTPSVTLTMQLRLNHAPIAYWSFNDFTVGQVLVPGVVGRAERFDQQKKGKEPMQIKTDLNSGHFLRGATFAAWIKPDKAGAKKRTVFSLGDEIAIGYDAGRTGVFGTPAMAPVESPADWHHLTVTLMGNTAQVFLDGKPAGKNRSRHTGTPSSIGNRVAPGFRSILGRDR